MQVRLFVGNLSWTVGDTELAELFAEHGDVKSARVISDRDTGRSRGFGFVEMDAPDVAAVIEATNGMEVDGRNLRVNEAEERETGSQYRSGGSGRRGRRD